MDVKSNFIFVGVSLIGCIVSAVVIKIKNEDWKAEGNSRARTLASICFIAFAASSVLTQVTYWMSR